VFRFLELSLHGWDFWQQVRVPLDRDVVLLVGPNGSGKTTLLDAIRQLLGARKLSSRRRLQHYLRQPDQPALIRAIVSNVPAESGQPPFFRERVLDREVTLACALVPGSGGSPEKRFAIIPGRASVGDIRRRLLDGKDYYPPEQYERALSNAGVSRSLMAVLAIEQGRTHQLFESTPRQLFHQVLDMLGDKAVLDRYADARRRYQDAQSEVVRQANSLTTKQTELQAMLREVERRNRWEEQRDKVEELNCRLPAAKYQKAWAEKEDLASKIQELRTKVRRGEVERASIVQAVAQATSALSVAKQAAGEARRSAENETNAWSDAKVAAKSALDDVVYVEAAVNEAGAYREADLETLEHQHEEALRHRFEAQRLIDDHRTKVARQEEELAILRTGVFVYPQPVVRTISELRNAAITFEVVSAFIEEVDDALAEAVESALGDARFALLVAADDEEQACCIAKSQGFPGPVYSGPRVDTAQRAGPVRYAVGAPSWLPDLLGETSFATDGSFCDRRGRWVRPNDGRFLGTKALQLAIAKAKTQLDALKQESSSMQEALQLSTRAEGELSSVIATERRRRELLKLAAGLPAARQRAEAATALLDQLEHARRHAEEDRDSAVRAQALAQTGLEAATRGKEDLERRLEGEKDALSEMEVRLTRVDSEVDVLRTSLTLELRHRAEAGELDGPETVEGDLRRARHAFEQMGEPPRAEVRLEAAQLENNVAELERHVRERTREADAAGEELEACRARYIEVVSHTLREYRSRAAEVARGADIVLEMDLPDLRNDDAILDEACISPRFGFDEKAPLPMGDSSFSGGQQVVAGLILLMAMAETEGRGFFLLDEPFAHLSIDRVDQVGRFLSASRSQFIITAPTTLDRGQLNPASMVIVLQKKRKEAPFAPPPLVAIA